ncbi:MAG: hypothetical protein EA366_09140 [Spirulina sp. DLM2.Bin59]|nr:MAG: hypothetical protein EA366_09140 [Spirulina sp. DLM2.Bin59]
MDRTNLYYINQGKRGKVDLCNICKQSASLSWDHVPPKGGIDLKPVEQVTILQHLTGNLEEQKPQISQNGVKYRTICKDCNERLGHSYDPVLNRFALGVGGILKSSIKILPIIHYKTQPAVLIRSILGHLLAAKGIIDDVVVDQKIREFLFDDQAQLPEDIKIFYWIYPYREIVVVRDVIMPAVRGKFDQVGFFTGILKYFPIAYLVCNLEQYEGLDELTIYRDLKIEETVEIPIHLTNIRHSTWPEMADNGNFMVGGRNLNSSVHARPRKA